MAVEGWPEVRSGGKLAAAMRRPGAGVRPTSGLRALRVALIWLGLTSLFVAGIEVALFVHGPAGPLWALLLFVAVGVEYVLVGLLAWSWRPSNRIGALVCVGGLAFLAAALENTDVPGLVAVGLILAVAPIGVIMHILLAFPSGRCDVPATRALVVAGYVITIALQAPRYLFAADPGALHIASDAGLVGLGTWVQNTAGAIVLLLTAFVLARRMRDATPAQRRVLAILYPYGIATVLFFEIATHVLPPLFGFGPITVFVLQISAAAVLPVAFAAGVLRGGFARSREIEQLRTWFETQSGGRRRYQDALADALGDRSLRLLFWLHEHGHYVDLTGTEVRVARGSTWRATVEIERGGDRICAIEYDALIIRDPELVREAGRVICLGLERERLTAELLASQEALKQSRVRIVQVADRERSRVARDLHDGLQVQLLLLAIAAGQLADDPDANGLGLRIGELRSGLVAACDELRAFVQGVMPALLIERGLYAATEDLVDRMPVPTRLECHHPDYSLPASVQQTGYFVVAEALTNAVKHARAETLAVSLARENGHLRIEVADDGVGGARPAPGSGLRGIADRLDAIGGELVVHSPPGEGTVINARLPCES
jgi:signal transduction histidine kinase